MPRPLPGQLPLAWLALPLTKSRLRPIVMVLKRMLDFGYDPQRDEVDIAATPYGQQDTDGASQQ